MGMTGGKGSQSTSSGFANTLGAIANQINTETDPSRRLFMSQLQQILSGNMFTNSTMPLIQSGVSAARQAGATSLMGAQSYLASTGVAQSPFAAAVMSLTGQQAQSGVASVPEQVAGSYLSQGMSSVAALGGQSLSGLSGAAQVANTTTSSSTGYDPSSLLGGLGGALGNQMMGGGTMGSILGGALMGGIL